MGLPHGGAAGEEKLVSKAHAKRQNYGGVGESTTVGGVGGGGLRLEGSLWGLLCA